MAPFTYSELGGDSVRLLKIHSLDFSNPDSSRLEVVHVLDSDLVNTRYEAVSYVWGSSKRRKKVTFVDGSILKITTTLKQALPRLIAASTTGMLWIDQLCIDQGNNGEKSQQVPKMGLIYTHAERTLAWLGVVPDAYTRFSRLIPTIHGVLDTWIKIHAEDPLLECPDHPATHVSAFHLLKQIVHNRRIMESSDWGAMLKSSGAVGFYSATGEWAMGTRTEIAGGYLRLLYRMRGGTKEYNFQPDYDEPRRDIALNGNSKKSNLEELEILAREDALIFYSYCAVLNIGTTLAEGKTEGLVSSLDTIVKNLWPLIQHAIGHPWCTRVWIMQEAKLSKNVEFLVNDELFKPQDILRLRDLLQFCHAALGNASAYEKDSHEAKWSHFFSRRDGLDPLSGYLIRRMLHTPLAIEAASDPRDLIYGLLPVCTPEPHLPTTDYDLNVSQVYSSTTRYFLARHNSLWVLQYCYSPRKVITLDHEDSGRTDLPSWVPDWSCHPLMTPLSTLYFPCIFNGGPRCEMHNDGRLFYCPECGDGGISYSASGRRGYVAIEENSLEVLTIRGKVVDQVMDLVFEPEDLDWARYLSDIFRSPKGDNRVTSHMNEIFMVIIERAARFRDVTTPLGRRDLLEFLLVTPFLYQTFPFRSHNLSKEDVLRHAEQGDASHPMFRQPELLKRWYSVLLGRNFALTHRGFYLGPDTMHIGDRIAIIHGSEFPLVIRPVNENEQTYVFVGQCMIRDQRVMFGDAIDWEEADAQVFRLV